MAGLRILEALDGLIETVEKLEVADQKQEEEELESAPVFQGKFGLKHNSVRALLQDPERFFNTTVVAKGWVESVRSGRFISITDGSCLKVLQVVADLDNEAMQEVVKQMDRGCSIEVRGQAVESDGQGQTIEVVAETIMILGACDKSYPIPKTKQGKSLKMETLRDMQHMRARTKVIRAAQTIRNEACKATHDFFYDRGFQYIHTPLITGADCEGAGEGFTVTTMLDNKGEARRIEDIPATQDGRVDFTKDFFKRQACLTVSGQLHVETYAHGVGSVYTFGPTFRAEESHTNRHLAEFWMIEPEVAFCQFSDVQDLAEDYLKYCLFRFLTNCPTEVNYLGQKFGREDNEGYLRGIVDADFVRMSYTEGVQILTNKIENEDVKVLMTQHKWMEVCAEIDQASHVENSCLETLERWRAERKIEVLPEGKKAQIENWKVIGPKKLRKKYSKYTIFENPVFWGVDLSSEHEKYLTQEITQLPTILTDYPQAIKSFYMKANEANDATPATTVQACDVLVPGVGEVIGGSQREDDLEKLDAMVSKTGIDPKEMSWYLDMRRYGSVPHGGFGLGLERLLMLATGIDNIRDIIPFPRYPGKCEY